MLLNRRTIRKKVMRVQRVEKESSILAIYVYCGVE